MAKHRKNRMETVVTWLVAVILIMIGGYACGGAIGQIPGVALP